MHERAQAWLPGGDTRTGTLFAPYPTYMDRGAGNYLYDVDSNRLLDFTNNATSIIHGHAHPALVRAIQRQAARGTGWNAPHASQSRLAQLLCERVPSLERVRFCNSGTEANMNAIKAARACTRAATGSSKWIAPITGATRASSSTARRMVREWAP